MEQILEMLRSLHTTEGLRQLVQTGGLVVLVAILFAETGLLVGFFLPGDSLLVTAGIFASGNAATGGVPVFNIETLLTLLTIAVICGDQTGYWLGRKAGPLIFKREDSLLFKRRYVEQAHAFYIRHGRFAIVIARFMPILRTFVPFTAGVATMHYPTFFKFSCLGSVIWINSIVLLGYFLGKSPLADELHTIILVVVFLSILPLLITMTKAMIRRFFPRKEVM